MEWSILCLFLRLLVIPLVLEEIDSRSDYYWI